MRLKVLKIGVLLLSLGILPRAGLGQEKLTLEQCYLLALRQSETVAISAQDIEKARARFQQALGDVLPQISMNFNDFIQDVPTSSDASSVGSTFTRRSRPELAITFNQVLFRGLQEITALRLTGSDKALQRYKKADVERLLFQDVATNFYTVAKIEQDIRTDQKILGVLNGQVKELKERVDLGKNRESELVAQEAAVSLVEADLEKLKGDRRVAYEALSFLTGLDPHPPILWRDPLQDKIQDIEAYVAATTTRPDVKADQETHKLAKGNVRIREGDLLPKADLEANLYPYRVGFQRDIQWDMLFNVNVPIFQWGNYGRIREAQASEKQAQLQARETQRLAINEVKKSYEAFQSSLRQYKKFAYAAQKTEESFRGQVDDFRKGLINNLDVLQTQRTWFDALRAKDDARVQSWLDWTVLQVNAGVLP